MSAEAARGSVSVVIAAYNAERWIAQTLDSVLGQTHPVLEVIVVDDGSTDETARIIRSYGGIVTFLQEAHRGRPYRNRGIRAARGEFVAFVDSDDFWDRRKIELQLRLMTATNAAWSICESTAIDSETNQPATFKPAPVLEGDILERLFVGNFIVASTPVVARHVFEDVGYFDEALERLAAEDWDMWLRIAARFPVACVREQLATLHMHADSFLASTPTELKVRNLADVARKAADREPRLRPLRGRALANIYYAAGVQAIRRQRLGEARHYFGAAVLNRPLHAEAVGYVILSQLGAPAVRALLGLKRRLWKGRVPRAS
jgi:glycosyltransferase involved in cell wall biosynthesis